MFNNKTIEIESYQFQAVFFRFKPLFLNRERKKFNQIFIKKLYQSFLVVIEIIPQKLTQLQIIWISEPLAYPNQSRPYLISNMKGYNIHTRGSRGFRVYGSIYKGNVNFK